MTTSTPSLARVAIPRAWGSSALRNRSPLTCCARAPYSAPRRSAVTKTERWTGATLVTIPHRGSARRHKASISPALSLASSRMAVWCAGARRLRLMGRPKRSLKLSLSKTARGSPSRWRRSVATARVVEVLPTPPVIPITRGDCRRRTKRAQDRRAARVSRTRTKVTPAGAPVDAPAGSGRRSQRTPAAPRRQASAMNSCPSARSVRTATNISPPRTLRESWAKPSKASCCAGPPRRAASGAAPARRSSRRIMPLRSLSASGGPAGRAGQPGQPGRAGRDDGRAPHPEQQLRVPAQVARHRQGPLLTP